MSRRRYSLAPAPPLDDEFLLEEILLRLPPQPSSLPRASLVCKLWRSILSDPQFLKRFRKHHREPPLLGFFTGHIAALFTAALDSPDRIPHARFSLPQRNRPDEQWFFMGCRHGLAVLINGNEREVVVWDPLTGQQHRVPFPSGMDNRLGNSFQAAVLCADAEDEHVHGDCFFCPFKLILVCTGYKHAFGSLYNSKSGVWGNIASTPTTDELSIRPSILIGNSVYWLFPGGDILAFDIERQTLGVIQKPPGAQTADYWSFQLLRTDDDSALCFANLSKLRIYIWVRKRNSYGIARWALQQKFIKLDVLFPQRMDNDYKKATMVGYDEESNVIVLGTYLGDFMLQPESMRFTRFSKRNSWDNKMHYPYTNFYTAGRGVGWKWLDLKL
ncbi:F-box/LRR-repeat/kelch-repeat protein At2g27520-like [Lolium rigidum]|uniref:F-box/LRR-repeat/kelch-repeat protein At2g27520-like n=1 Tax=Lolium rigidum TaxID=89674 RepID=UPI001F5C3619|nr:F-box/LRR-repeat/kelch-repeat protein At2g27520-like [Lolium rigidum]